MNPVTKMIKRTARCFARDEGGMASVDMILMFPLYLFSIMGVYTYWDAWDVVNRSQKAAYTVSDLITREMAPVSEAYVAGLFSTMDYMMGPSLPTETRITSVFYNGAQNRYLVIWSRSSDGGFPPLTTGTVSSIQSHLPEMADGDAVVVVETSTQYEPIIGESVKAIIAPLAGDKDHVIITRPRFVNKICMLNVDCGDM